MHVLLVHGLGRTPLSLIRLGAYLRRHQHDAEFFGYVAMLERFDAVRSRLRKRLEQFAERTSAFAVIGHSLGGVLLQAALINWPKHLNPPAHLITLGTPTRVPRLVQRAHKLWPYRLLAGEAGQVLADADALHAPGALEPRWTVISGTRGWRGRWSPFGTEANDGLVAVSETRSAMASVHIEVPAVHTFMMEHAGVRATIIQTLAGVETVAPGSLPNSKGSGDGFRNG